ncbi:hypothetical protein [Streptosporangium sp. NPDC000396]|uniref:hypothetical protein n=1 Tax=Streptosporangium sp. NPDC000396 TaxID=3366185 RepID=UPI00367C12A8
MLLATATGATIFAGGTATASAAPLKAAAAACSLNTADVTDIKFDDAYIPLKDDATIGFEATIKDPYKLIDGTGGDAGKKFLQKNVTNVTAQFQRVGETIWNDAVIEQVAAPPAGPQTSAPADVKIKGSFKTTKDNKDGKWQVRLLVTRDAVGARESCKEVDVTSQVKFVSASVTDPVVIVAGEDTQVIVRANIIGASSVTAHLYSNASNDSVDLELSKNGTADQWYKETWFDDDFSTGSWTLDLTAGRGKESVKFERADTFYVQGGSSKPKKAKAKVSFDVSANKVKKGKKVRLYGTAYRGSSAYSGKMIELYYKKKGSSGWKFSSFVKANGSGKFSKTVKPKFDAYWRAVAPGTSKTYAATSGAEFVDVR